MRKSEISSCCLQEALAWLDPSLARRREQPQEENSEIQSNALPQVGTGGETQLPAEAGSGCSETTASNDALPATEVESACLRRHTFFGWLVRTRGGA